VHRAPPRLLVRGTDDYAARCWGDSPQSVGVLATASSPLEMVFLVVYSTGLGAGVSIELVPDVDASCCRSFLEVNL